MDGPFLALTTLDGRAMTVDEHTEAVSELAAQYAAGFQCSDIARGVAGMLDVGMYSSAYQSYALRTGPFSDYTLAGAYELNERGMPWAAFCVSCHGRYLMDHGQSYSKAFEGTFVSRLKRIPADYSAWNGEVPDLTLPDFAQSSLFSYAFFIRMLYSCLEDADFHCREPFLTGRTTERRFPSMPALLDRLMRSRPVSEHAEVNGIFSTCLRVGRQERGAYSLTVPPGGGKLTAALAFAISHAVQNRMGRVVYLVSHRDSLTQTAAALRRLLGKQAVMEYHTVTEPIDLSDDSEALSDTNIRYSESWDASVVVATDTQFFESLFACRSRKVRKLHNLADCVVVFDEAHLIPNPCLYPCIAALQELVTNYLTTFLFASSMCPDIQLAIPLAPVPIRPVLSGPALPFDHFQHIPVEVLGPMSDGELTAALEMGGNVLVVMNLPDAATGLYMCLPGEGTYLLTEWMTPADRRNVKLAIQGRFVKGKPFRVICTALVAPDLDFAFSCIYRESAGLDEILLTTACCCPRDGTALPGSRIRVFTRQTGPDSYSVFAGSADRAIQKGTDIYRADTAGAYFQALHQRRGRMNLDKDNVMWGVVPDPKFAEMRRRFHYTNLPANPVIIENELSAPLIRLLAGGDRSEVLAWQLAEHTVFVPNAFYSYLRQNKYVTLIDEKRVVLSKTELYSPETGMHIGEAG